MKTRFSLFILIAWLTVSVTGLILPLNPNEINLKEILSLPGHEHWLGSDDLGRPILDRLIQGAIISLGVAIFVTLLTSVTGIIVGLAGVWIGGWADHLLVRTIDLFMAFPGLLLAIALAGILGPGINNLVLALSIVGWVSFARLTRAQALSLKNRDHILAARALGTPEALIPIKHIVPLLSAPLLVEATYTFSNVIIAEAGLSFLGIGVQPPDASWGNMIREGARFLLVAPHMVLSPGIALALMVLAVNLLGDELRDRMDIKSFDIEGGKK